MKLKNIISLVQVWCDLTPIFGNMWINIDYIIDPDLIDEEVIRRNLKDVYNRIYYISGPFNMVNIIKRILLKMNIDEKDMVIDYFPGYDD